MTGPARTDTVGFHEGELAVQRRAGVSRDAARLSAMIAPARLSTGVAQFLAERTFAAITARDTDGTLWLSPLTGPPGFLHVGSPTALTVRTSPAEDDPLRGLPTDQPVGLIAVEFAARRRLRVNGTLSDAGNDGLRVDVEQAFGNCPQYIQGRRLRGTPVTARSAAPVRRGRSLTPDDADLIRRSDTFLVGTTPTPPAATTPRTAAEPPDSSASRTEGCGGPTTRATTCSPLSATSKSTPTPPCSSATSPPAAPCTCPAGPRWSGPARAPPATTTAPAAASTSFPGTCSPATCCRCAPTPWPLHPTTRRSPHREGQPSHDRRPPAVPTVRPRQRPGQGPSCRLRKSLWGFRENRMAVRFQYEWHDAESQWFRSYGNELWEFADNGLMRRREASINDLRIDEADRRYFGPRPRDERGPGHDIPLA